MCTYHDTFMSVRILDKFVWIASLHTDLFVIVFSCFCFETGFLYMTMLWLASTSQKSSCLCHWVLRLKSQEREYTIRRLGCNEGISEKLDEETYMMVPHSSRNDYLKSYFYKLYPLLSYQIQFVLANDSRVQTTWKIKVLGFTTLKKTFPRSSNTATMPQLTTALHSYLLPPWWNYVWHELKPSLCMMLYSLWVHVCNFLGVSGKARSIGVYTCDSSIMESVIR